MWKARDVFQQDLVLSGTYWVAFQLETLVMIHQTYNNMSVKSFSNTFASRKNVYESQLVVICGDIRCFRTITAFNLGIDLHDEVLSSTRSQ